MNQPDLGKRIVELRKAKGLTQEELVAKCNLSVRTLQRIESGEVTPRSYTMRIIFEALDYNIQDSLSGPEAKSHQTGFSGTRRLEQLYRYVLDLFNLRTNTMKKISILTVVVFAVSLLLVTVTADSEAQTQAKVKKTIEASNDNFVRWFNTGQIDSILTLYKDDACFVGLGCGKTFIGEYFTTETSMYQMQQLNVHEVNVSGSMAVEKGQWVMSSNSGEEIRGEYLAEWVYADNKWVIQKEVANVKPQ